MKLHLPPHILHSLVAAFCLAASAQAQSSQLQSWENVTLPSEGTSFLVLDDNDTPAPIEVSKLKYLQLADGTTPTFHTDARYVSADGELLSSSDPNSYIIDPDTGLRVMMAGPAVTTAEISYYSYIGNVTFDVGTIVLGGHYGLNHDGETVPMLDRDLQIGELAQFATATSSEIYVDALWKSYGPSLYMGKSNQSWGSDLAPVNTSAIINLPGAIGGDDIASIVGGNTLDALADADTTFHGSSTTILLNQSYVGAIVGGNSTTEDSSHRASFVGDVRISLQDEAGSNVIVGGNSGHGGDFTGDVNIAIHSPVTGQYGDLIGITGANRLYAASDSTFTGNTNILVTSARAEASEVYLYGDIFIANNGIIGGYATETEVGYSVDGVDGVRPGNTSFHLVSYEGTTAQLTGTTNIELNFESKYTSGASVGQAIIGGSLVSGGLNLNHDGGSKITITGAENVGFYRWVVGGNLVNDVSNGEYYDWDGSRFPYMDRNNMATAYIKSVEIKVDSGDFISRVVEGDNFGVSSLFTVGSMSAGGGDVETGSTQATITGGSFNTIVGGNTSIAVKLDFDGMGMEDYTSGASVMGDVNLSISGVNTSVQAVVGGSYLSDSLTGVQGLDAVTKEVIFLEQAASVGDVNVSITGGYIGAVTSGSYIGQNIASAAANGEGYLVTQGNLKLSLKGQSTMIGDLVAGAGIISGLGQYTEANIAAQEYVINTVVDSLAAYIGVEIADLGMAYLDDLTDAELAAMMPPTISAGDLPSGGVVNHELEVRAVTESTLVEIGNEVEFDSLTTISGGYLGSAAAQNSVPPAEWSWEVAQKDAAIRELLLDWYVDVNNSGNAVLAAWAQEWIDAYNSAFSLVDPFIDNYTASGAVVTGNRELVFSDQSAYSNLANTRIIEFDEVETARGAVVDFAQNGQDLDSLGGRNSLSADGIHVIQNDFNGTNTLRKTGQGVLKLSDTNGQINGQDNLQLVVEEGTVVLAQNSAGVDKTNFKTLVVQSGATLDMKAGDNTEAGAAGINGHLNLEQDAILVADASRYMADSGTSMDAGKLTVNMDFVLNLDNTDGVQALTLREVSLTEALPAGTSVTGSFTLGAFEIVLFSDLLEIDGITFYDANWGGDSVQIAFAADYISHLGDLVNNESLFVGNDNGVWENNELYLIWKNNDLILTSGSALMIPEPSTATLSLLALAGLLARRRRKAL